MDGLGDAAQIRAGEYFSKDWTRIRWWRNNGTPVEPVDFKHDGTLGATVGR